MGGRTLNFSTLPLPTQAHLSDVYWGKSKVNNETPRSVTNPPPWANLDPRVLSPIPDKKKREACWDDSFPLGNCLQPKEARRSSKPAAVRKRPASAGVRRGHQESPSANNMVHGNSSGSGDVKKLQGGVKGRPSSADVRRRDSAYDNIGNGYTTSRGDTITQRVPGVDGTSGYSAPGCSSRDSGSRTSGGDKGRSNQGRGSGAFSTEEREILAGGYRLNASQESTFRDFVAMLVDFDTCSMVRILDDVFRETQLATGLQDFTGCGEN